MGYIISGGPTALIFQIKDVFAGVKYLHARQPPICHGDLKSVGRLTDAYLIARISLPKHLS